MNSGGGYVDHERVLQNHHSVETGIAILHPMDNAFYSYQPKGLRKWFGLPKYFRLKYTVTVGNKTYPIEMVR